MEVSRVTPSLHLSHRERSDREAIRVSGYSLSIILFPLTPTLSPTGRGSARCSWQPPKFNSTMA
jgi:hypothetical protein